MTGIADLPQELISMVADYLHRRDRIRFATSCRSHYKALIGHLWKELHLESDHPHYVRDRNPITPLKPFIASDRLEQHASYVHFLSLHGPFQPEHYAIKFPRLHTLMLQYDTPFYVPNSRRESSIALDITLDVLTLTEIITSNANFLRLNPTVKHLKIQLCILHPQPSAIIWDAIATSLHNPTSFHVSRMSPPSIDEFNSFWRACTLFEELNISGSQLGQTELLPQLSFPRLRRITLDVYWRWGVTCFAIPQQVAWLRQCPNLTKLDWKSTSSILASGDFLRALEQKAWPHLEDLSLGNFRSWVEFVPMFSLLPPLRRFRLVSEQFSMFDFLTFRERLFGEIRVLDMAQCFGFTSSMALKVLEECAQLQELKTFFIDAKELDTEARPWVCRGLKRLETLILAESEVSNEQAFEALSQLTNLEHMDFGLDHISVDDITKFLPEGYKCLQWTLDSGLDRLLTLTKVRNLGFSGTEQELTEEDLEWMLNSWPLLEGVRGKFSGDAGYHGALVDMLKERHIAHF